MLKKTNGTTHCKRCGKEFGKKRTEQNYCSPKCRKAAWNRIKKRRLSPSPSGVLGSVRNGAFSSSKSVACKPPPTPDFGALVRAQVVAQQDESNPVSFASPQGTKFRVWFASDSKGKRIIGDDRHWRVNVSDLLKQDGAKRSTAPWKPTAEMLRRPIIVVGRNDPVRDVDDALLTVKGFKLRICIEGEKELQILGCGWRIVICQFRANKVLLHHNGNVATMKRKDFKELLAAVRAVRPKRIRPTLRLVVSNSNPRVLTAAAA